jgi:hypothetical protein
MYNADFAGAHQALDAYQSAHRDDPIGYSVRAAAYLFGEMDRLMILESEFFADDKRIAEKKKLKADPTVRAHFYKATGEAERLANSRLAVNAADKDALFALCIKSGVVTDYLALVEKKQLSSLPHARESQNQALRLLKADPNFYDAYLTTGLSEYLIGSLPFFVRWFVKFDQTQGSKSIAVQNLEKVVAHGRYFRPFAKILLSVIHLREKRPSEAEKLLTDLARDYPGNPLYQKELAKVSAKVRARSGGSR